MHEVRHGHAMGVTIHGGTPAEVEGCLWDHITENNLLLRKVAVPLV